MSEVYEIFPLKPDSTPAEWQQFLNTLLFHHKLFDTFTIDLTLTNHLIEYHLHTPRPLPSSFENFLLKKTGEICQQIIQAPHQHPTQKHSPKSFQSHFSTAHLHFSTPAKNSCKNLNSYLRLHHNSSLKSLIFTFKKLPNKTAKTYTSLITSKNQKSPLHFAIPATLLAINFKTENEFLRKSPPKFLNLSNSLPLFSPEKSFLKIDTFPYSQETLFLNLSKPDFEKHTVVFGASGSGKSKFLSLLVENYLKNKSYKIIILDPHASLENDLGGLGKVIDFKSDEDSLDLFKNESASPIVATELLLNTFQNLLSSSSSSSSSNPNSQTPLNPKLERVLHHSFFLLITLNNFNFKTLRNLLLDTDFRNNLVSKNRKNLPENLVTFFLTEFSEIKTTSFNDAIAPIITFIDELEILPAFRTPHISKSLSTTLLENQLTIFSLDRASLGSRAVKTLSSLLMCQLFSLIQNREIPEHLIFIIDEVAVIENPILTRFLSEARKFSLTLILAGQYFSAISPNLQSAIFANVANFTIFRASKDDASLLVQNINFKLALTDSPEEKIKLLTDLKDRECVLRLSSGGKLIPAFKCLTMDFISHPRKRKKSLYETQFKNLKPEKFDPKFFTPNTPNILNIPNTLTQPFSFAKPSQKFSSKTSANLHEILTLTSTRRHSARELMNQK